MSANVKTAGIAKINKVRISEESGQHFQELSEDLVRFDRIEKSLRDEQAPLAEANASLKSKPDKKLALERVKTSNLEKKVHNLESLVANLQTKILELRNENKKLGFGSLTKKIKVLEGLLESSNLEIQELTRRDNLEYQIRAKYKKYSETLISSMRKFDLYIQQRENSGLPRENLELQSTELLSSVKDNSVEFLIKSAFKPLTYLFEKVGNVIHSKISNLETNRTEALQKSIENWKNNPQYVSKDLADLRARNRELEEKQQDVDKILAQKDLELQQIKVQCHYGVDIFSKRYLRLEIDSLGSKNLLTEFQHGIEQIKEAERAEAELPDAIRSKIQSTFLQNFALRVKTSNCFPL